MLAFSRSSRSRKLLNSFRRSIIAAFETGILITLALYAHVFHVIKWPRPWQSKLSDEFKKKPHASHIGAAGFMFSVLPEEDITPKRKLFGIDRKLAHNLLGTAVSSFTLSSEECRLHFDRHSSSSLALSLFGSSWLSFNLRICRYRTLRFGLTMRRLSSHMSLLG